MKKIILLNIVASIICFSSFSQLNVDVDLNTGSINSNIHLWTVTSQDIQYPISLHYNSQGVKAGQFSSNVGYGWNISHEAFISRSVMGLPDDYDTPDRKGWLVGSGAQLAHNFSGISDNDISNLSDESSDFVELYTMFKCISSDTLILDTEPDVFSINAPGLSAKFVFDNDGVIKTLSYQDLTIEKLEYPGGTIRGFQVTNSDGIQYTFDRGRSLEMKAFANPAFSDASMLYFRGKYLSYRKSISFENQWFLTSILSNNGGEIDFSYTEVVDEEYDKYVSLWSDTYLDTTKFYNSAGSEIWEYYVKYVESNKIRLNSIETSQERTLFTDREMIISDLSSNLAYKNAHSTILRNPLLNGIFVSAKGVDQDSLIQKYLFNYKKFDLAPFKQNAVQFFLQSIQVNSTNLNSDEKALGYSFEYNNVDWLSQKVRLPYLNTDSVDAYGFYGTDGQKKFPSSYLYRFNTQERYFNYPVLDYGTTVDHLPGNDQSSDFFKISTGVLNTLKTTQGQSYHMNYELNQFYNSLTNQNMYAGGIRVKSLTVSDGVDDLMTTNYQYVDELGQSTGTIINEPKFAFTSSHAVKKVDGSLDYYKDLSTSSSVWSQMTLRSDRDLLTNMHSYVWYNKVKTVNDAGSMIYDYYVDNSSNNTNKQKYAILGFIGSSNNYYYSLGNIEPYDSYPFAPEDHLVNKHGFLKSIERFDNQGSLLSDQFFYYSTFRNTVPVKAIRIEPTKVLAYFSSMDQLRDGYIYDEYVLETDSRYTLDEEVSTTYDAVNKTVSKIISVDTYGNPTEISTTLPEGSISKERFRYAYDLEYSTASSNESIAYNRMLTDGGYSRPIESVSTLQRPGESERITGGQVAMVDWEVSRLFDREIFQMAEQKEYTNFNPVTINSNGDVVIDPGYELVSEISLMNQYGVLETKHPKLERYSSYLYQDERIIGAFSNAKNNQIAFSHFDNETPSYHDFDDIATTYGPGRHSERSYLLGTSALTKEVVSDGVTNEFVFSFWTRSDNSTSITLKVVTASNADKIYSIPVSASPLWKYYEKTIDISDLTHQSGDIMDIELTSSSLKVDDVAFYPSKASLRYSNIKYGVSKASTNNHGKSIYRKYAIDKVETLDQDGNILSIDNFTYTSSIDLGVAIKWNGDITVDETTIFFADFMESADEIINSSTYSWVITGNESLFDEFPENITYPSSSTNSAKSYTFSSSTDHVVFLKATRLTKTYYQKVFISKDKIKPSSYVPPPNINLCIKGPTGWDVCTDEATGYSQGCVTLETTGGYTLSVNTLGGTGTYKFKWYSISSPGSSNKTALNSTFEASNHSYSVTSIPSETKYYTVEVQDDQNNLINHLGSLEFKVIESTPNCPQQ